MKNKINAHAKNEGLESVIKNFDLRIKLKMCIN